MCTKFSFINLDILDLEKQGFEGGGGGEEEGAGSLGPPSFCSTFNMPPPS